MSKETTRKMLQLSMQQLLRERRFSAITVDDICRHAGVSRKTFYRYYPDRHALLSAVYNDCYFSFIEVSAEDSFWDVFRKICKQISTDKPFITISAYSFGVLCCAIYISYTFVTSAFPCRSAYMYTSAHLVPASVSEGVI